MIPHPRNRRTSAEPESGGPFVVTWGQIVFVLFWAVACGLHRWSAGAWPNEWTPLAYLLPAGLVGLTWDWTVGHAFHLRPVLVVK